MIDMPVVNGKAVMNLTHASVIRVGGNIVNSQIDEGDTAVNSSYIYLNQTGEEVDYVEIC